MADTKREIERKYELPAPSDAHEPSGLPELTGVKGVASVRARGVVELDAVYYDTADLRLTAGHVTLRRRTGGGDEGWHLKFPVSTGIRDEIRAPLADTLPDELAALVRSRVRSAGLVPVVRLMTSRDVFHLLDAKGTLLAEVSVDAVRARRLTGDTGGEDAGTASWTEVEVELGDDADPAILDAVEKKLRKAGLRPASAASKLARALAETAPGGPGPAAAPAKGGPRGAGDHILAYLRDQADAIIAQDPAVRRDLPDSVHQLRVATRRMRSAFRTYRGILDRSVTDPVAEELQWVATELGVDRDHEVLDERLSSRIDALPVTLLLGPVRGRLQAWDAAQRAGSRSRTVAVLDSERYLTLLDTLDGLLTAPPLRPDAARPAAKVLPRAILKNYERLAGRVGQALALAPGEERDLAMHNARKAAKRARYAAEAARPALGKAAKRFANRMKALQTALGDHQDSVVAREALRDLAVQAHAAGESAFTWGLLYGEEEAQGERRERELPGLWEEASDPRLRADLTG
ncbi:CYTH and CHAD domain-containing protein [Streptomyces scopuliridis]|uniref:Metal-binding protein n=1 Tax=Streptomyces scopuliridis RB72 TaxID=1440053 RepID=A0A2T7SVD9_9ACTN|nr:CYTH and CHAD domain-containing protein [Streptomyces scopuliridis]PVE06847.1 metal-binding protein [Streptomyces scopuliridis RB72]